MSTYRAEQFEMRAHGLDVLTVRCTMPDCGWLELLDDTSPRLRDIQGVCVGHWQDAHMPPPPSKKRRRPAPARGRNRHR